MEERLCKDFEDDCERELIKEIGEIEKEREAIEKEIRETDADLELLDEVQRNMRGFFKEIWKCWEAELFFFTGTGS